MNDNSLKWKKKLGINCINDSNQQQKIGLAFSPKQSQSFLFKANKEIPF